MPTEVRARSTPGSHWVSIASDHRYPGAKKRPMPRGIVIWPGSCFAAASPPRTATIVAIAMSRFRLRYISQALEVVEVDGPVVVDARHAFDVVVLGEVGEGNRRGGGALLIEEVVARWRQRCGQPRVRLHVLHVQPGRLPGDRRRPRRGVVKEGGYLLRILVAVADEHGIDTLVGGDHVARAELRQAPVGDGDLLGVHRGLEAGHLV